jgi:hypothetical protein
MKTGQQPEKGGRKERCPTGTEGQTKKADTNYSDSRNRARALQPVRVDAIQINEIKRDPGAIGAREQAFPIDHRPRFLNLVISRLFHEQTLREIWPLLVQEREPIESCCEPQNLEDEEL